jgi:DNA-binding transcriptional ArsR family regulator
MLLGMSRSAAAESVFHAIASPTRRALLDELAAKERNVGELVTALDVSQSAVSQQLAILREAGLVEERAEGRFRWYRLRAKPLAEIDHWIRRYRTLIEQQLDDLGRVLDELPDTPAESRERKRRRP